MGVEVVSSTANLEDAWKDPGNIPDAISAVEIWGGDITCLSLLTLGEGDFEPEPELLEIETLTQINFFPDLEQ